MLIPRCFHLISSKDLGFIYRSFPSPPLVLLDPKAVTDYFHVAAWLPPSAKEGLCIFGVLLFISRRGTRRYNTHRLCAFLHPSSFTSTGSHYRILGLCAGWLTLIFRVRLNPRESSLTYGELLNRKSLSSSLLR